ncbi:MAG: acyltransferase family protein [Pseudomonadota bacterium]
MQYRAEIDGLRALAVIPVILFHAGFDLFGGGYVGVDVFFVISGYLITTIIHTEIQAGSFSILGFYDRRIRRILPALMLVCLVSIPFAWMWMLPNEFRNFAQSLVAISVFASNILFWLESDYFAAAAELKPMLHTWSLAVEEQFYVFFPLFLLLFRRLTVKSLLAVIILCAIVSLALAEWASTTHPIANFYLLPTRAWELAVGAMLALTAPTWLRTDGVVAQTGSALGFGMILYAVFAFDESTPFPSLWALIPVIGTALVVAFTRPRTLVGRMLCWSPVVGIGLISYSAYLWHQPLFAFARIRLLDHVTPDVYLGLSVAALVLAYLSWRFVERPFRQRTVFSRRQIFVGAACVSVLVAGFGMFGHLTRGLPQRLPPDAIQMAALSGRPDARTRDCHANIADQSVLDESCLHAGERSDNLIIWGDSHAVELAGALTDTLAAHDTSVRQFSSSACVPALGVYRARAGLECVRFTEHVMDYLLEQPPTTIVVVARWPVHLELEPFDNMEGGVLPDHLNDVSIPLGSERSAAFDPDRIDKVGTLYRETVESLLANGHRVVLVYPVPEVGWSVPIHLAREIQFGIEREGPLSTSHDVFRERTAQSYQQLDLLGENANLIRVKPETAFCDTYVAGRCVAQLDGDPLYFDGHHVNTKGATMIADQIIDAMTQKGWLAGP